MAKMPFSLRTFNLPHWRAEKLRRTASENGVIFRGFKSEGVIFDLSLKNGIITMPADPEKVAMLLLLAAQCAVSPDYGEHLNMLDLRTDAVKKDGVTEWIAYPYATDFEGGDPPKEWLTLGQWMIDNGFPPSKLLLDLSEQKLNSAVDRVRDKKGK